MKLNTTLTTLATALLPLLPSAAGADCRLQVVSFESGMPVTTNHAMESSETSDTKHYRIRLSKPLSIIAAATITKEHGMKSISVDGVRANQLQSKEVLYSLSSAEDLKLIKGDFLVRINCAE